MWEIRKLTTLVALCSLVLVVFTNSAFGQNDLVPSSEQGIRDLEWSPNGERLAIANPDGQVRIINRDNQQLTNLVADAEMATTVAWSPDSETLVTGGIGPNVRVWNASTGGLLRQLDGFLSGVVVLSWHPAGTMLLVSGFDTFQVVDSTAWTAFTEPLSVSFNATAWSPDGSRFAAATINRTIAIINTAALSERPIRFTSLDGHDAIATSVNWSPDGRQLVSAGGRDGSVRLWDVESATQTAVLLQTNEFVRDAAFTDSGRMVTAVTDSGTIYMIGVTTGQISARIVADTQLWTIAWNPQYELLALGGLDTSVLNTNAIQTDVATATVDAQETGFLQILPP